MFQFLLYILISTSHIVTSQGEYTTTNKCMRSVVVLCSVVIIQSPQNVSVCEGGTVTFSCVVMFPSGSNPAGAFWIASDVDASREPGHTATNDDDGRSSPTNVTNTLMVANVNTSNNGTDYRCVQDLDVISDRAHLTVFGELFLYVFITLFYHCYCDIK